MIKLDEHSYVKHTVDHWTLVCAKPSDRGNGKTTSNQSYHTNLKQALIRFCDFKMGQCEDMEEVVNKINELENFIETLK